MKNRPQTDQEIITWLQQEQAQPFSGWDFSYIRDRRIPLGSLPWDYAAMVKRHLLRATSLLDTDTGGGERLAEVLTNTGFKGKVSAVEAYSPNVSIARGRLAEFGVEVHDTSPDAGDTIAFDDASFDLVTNRHGGSVDNDEVFRILSPSGIYVSEQVGDRTNVELLEIFDSAPTVFESSPYNAEAWGRALTELGFAIEGRQEHTYPVRFHDVGALVYYLKAIPWAVPEFSLERDAATLIELHRRAADRGYAIDATYHAYIVAARKP